METVFAERVQKANVIAALAQMKLFNERRKSPSAIPNSEVGEGEGDDEGEREEGGRKRRSHGAVFGGRGGGLRLVLDFRFGKETGAEGRERGMY